MLRKKRESYTENSNYWLSIGDLMSSVVIIFILIFIYQILDVKEKVYPKVKQIKVLEAELHSKEAAVDELSKALQSKEAIIDDLTNVKNKIIEKLNGEFEKENLKIIMDKTTGVIQLDEKILFDYGKDQLKKQGKAYLQRFIPLYADLLLSDESIRNQLEQIIIEGHTDEDGSYLYNLGLSQRRALNVVEFIFSADMPDFDNKEDLKNYITANGRSFIKAIRNEDGTINADRSRRVEFQFKLKDDEALQTIREQIQTGR